MLTSAARRKIAGAFAIHSTIRGAEKRGQPLSGRCDRAGMSGAEAIGGDTVTEDTGDGARPLSVARLKRGVADPGAGDAERLPRAARADGDMRAAETLTPRFDRLSVKPGKRRERR
jgi:hypothetical protein